MNVTKFQERIFSRTLISRKIIGFMKIVGEIQQLVRKRSQKINYDVILHYISFIHCTFQSSAPYKNNKKR